MPTCRAVLSALILLTAFAYPQAHADIDWQRIFQNGQQSLWLGVSGAGPHQLPSGFDTACDSGWFLSCGTGMRLAMDFKPDVMPGRGPERRTFYRLALDAQDYSGFDFRSIIVSKVIGATASYRRLIGAGANATAGLGLSQVSVNEDKSYTPLADVSVELYYHLSRLVFSVGLHYRQLVSTRVDGHSYGPASRGGYVGLAFSF